VLKVAQLLLPLCKTQVSAPYIIHVTKAVPSFYMFFLVLLRVVSSVCSIKYKATKLCLVKYRCEDKKWTRHKEDNRNIHDTIA
jgi:hypothetical protein